MHEVKAVRQCIEHAEAVFRSTLAVPTANRHVGHRLGLWWRMGATSVLDRDVQPRALPTARLREERASENNSASCQNSPALCNHLFKSHYQHIVGL